MRRNPFKGIIHIEAVLTPSRNQMDKLIKSNNIKKIKKMKRDYDIAVYASVPCLFNRTSAAIYDHVFAYAIRCSKRRLDHTNLIGGLKWLEDALVRCEVIKDDSPNNITWVGKCAEERSPRHWGKLRGPCTHLLLSETEEKLLKFVNS